MKILATLLLSLTGIQVINAQEQGDDPLLILFTNTLDDSVRIEINIPEQSFQLILNSNKCTGWSDFFMIVPRCDSVQKLTIYNINSGKTVETILDKRSRFLFVYKNALGFHFNFKNTMPPLACGTCD